MHRFLALLILITAASQLIAQEEPRGPSINAIVTIRVNGMNEAQWREVSARVGREAHVNIEYSCTASGVMVLRLRQIAATERSDVMTLVKGLLHEAGVKGHIDFLDVHVEPGDGNRCSVTNRFKYCSG